MRVVLLGTGGYFPNDRRQTACIMLPEIGVLLDAGTGMFRAAQNPPARELDVFLSHAHLDHVCGLTTLLVPLSRGDVDRVRIHATAETLAAVKNHLFAEPLFPIHPPFDYRQLIPETRLPGGAVVTYLPLTTHPGGSTGFRVTWQGRSLAYITDTVADRRSLEFIRGVDLLLHECNFSDDKAEWAEMTGHSHTTPVAELARDAGVGRLVLVHLDALNADHDPVGIESARAIFPQTELGFDLWQLEC